MTTPAPWSRADHPHTVVYRGCEIWQRRDGRWSVWWLAIADRQGHLGVVDGVDEGRRLVDAAWDEMTDSR